RLHVSARGVHVDLDRLVPGLVLQVQHLGDDGVGDAVVDGGADVDDAVAEQPGEDVGGTLGAVDRALDDAGDGVAAHRPGPAAAVPVLSGRISARSVITRTQIPQSPAAAASQKWALSESRGMVSRLRPVRSAVMSISRSRLARRSSAWISMSAEDLRANRD